MKIIMFFLLYGVLVECNVICILIFLFYKFMKGVDKFFGIWKCVIVINYWKLYVVIIKLGKIEVLLE